MAAKIGAGAVGAGVLLGLAVGVSNSVYTVEGGHRSILFSRFGGLKDTVYKEGQ